VVWDLSNVSWWQEGEFDLATMIKAAGCYRQSNKWDPVLDYVTVTEKEAATYFDKNVKYVIPFNWPNPSAQSNSSS